MKCQVLNSLLVIGVGLSAALLSVSCAIAPRVDGPIFTTTGSNWTFEQCPLPFIRLLAPDWHHRGYERKSRHEVGFEETI